MGGGGVAASSIRAALRQRPLQIPPALMTYVICLPRWFDQERPPPRPCEATLEPLDIQHKSARSVESCSVKVPTQQTANCMSVHAPSVRGLIPNLKASH